MESDKISTKSTSNKNVAEIKLELDDFNSSMVDEFNNCMVSAQIENNCKISELLQNIDQFGGIISSS